MKTTTVILSSTLGALLGLIVIALSGMIVKSFGPVWAFTFVGAITITLAYVVYKTIK